MRILHLGYEDPRQPGSGGGSVRTREINRRLSDRHAITVVVAGYPGARVRVEDGVRWVPVGPRTGGKIDRLAYFALAQAAVRRVPHDLLVEDFSAPFSVSFAPAFTRRPVVASVQWLFAREMRRKYGLPFDLVERGGLTLYESFIAVSEWLARELRTRRPGAAVTCIPNAVPSEAFLTTLSPPAHLLFLGRLDLEQKGGDLLIESYAHLGADAPPLVVAGDGPAAESLRRLARARGVAERVRFVGRVEGAEKYALIGAAHAVLMPSRFETFGLVAVEAQASGVPVVAFDVGPLAEVTGRCGAALVPAFDVRAFADATREVLRTPPSDEQRTTAREWARQYDWNKIALRQEAWYLARVAAPCPR